MLLLTDSMGAVRLNQNSNVVVMFELLKQNNELKEGKKLCSAGGKCRAGDNYPRVHYYIYLL